MKFISNSNKSVLLTIFLLAFSKTSHANEAEDFKAASKAACEKMKQCAMAQMDVSELSPEMRKMAEGMVSNMCVGLIEFDQVSPYKALYKPAAACMQSMAALSCNDLMEGDEVSTPACADYERLAKRYQ